MVIDTGVVEVVNEFLFVVLSTKLVDSVRFSLVVTDELFVTTVLSSDSVAVKIIMKVFEEILFSKIHPKLINILYHH